MRPPNLPYIQPQPLQKRDMEMKVTIIESGENNRVYCVKVCGVEIRIMIPISGQMFLGHL
jgi:hypothetical protein